MPSFVTDDVSSPADSSNADVVNLEPCASLGLANEHKGKVNGDAIRHPIHHAALVHEPFDESSTASTHESELDDGTPMAASAEGAQGLCQAPAANHIKTTSGRGSGIDVVKNALLPNGTVKAVTNNAMTLPDRTAVPASTGASGRGMQTQLAATADDCPPEMDAPGPSPTAVPPPAGNLPRPAKRSTEAMLPPTLPTIPSESVPDGHRPPLTQCLTHASLGAEPAQHKAPPHRLSSPPIYQTGIYTSTMSSSGHLQPPQAVSTPRQRHTLEVPKLSPARPSRDAMDTAQASGRFSPTVAGVVQRRASLSLVRRTTRSMQSDYPRDEIAPDEDVMRWAEAYRQKRASKRRRKEEEDDDRVLVGTKVDESHANWVTAYNMLTGIRVSVSRTNAKLDRELTDADFEAKQKSTFDIAGNELVPSAKYDFKFKDYAPWVFRRLRALFRLDPADYLMSLTGKYILSELGSPGKSGSFFYFSRDYRYIIKTIHHSEHKFLRKILKDYYQHVENNPNTLLSQFYGLHRVKMPYGKKIHFVVMNNLFPPHRDIHMTFDLKGSTVGRNYREEDLQRNPRATLKDLNWLRRQRHLELGIQKKRLFLEQLQRDVKLLRRLQIMDYSLLVGVHDVARGNEENLRDKTLRVFNPGGERTSEGDASALPRTPSKVENARKARELRQMLHQERPVPIGQATDKMPDELGESQTRPGFVFNQDDGGFQATHEDNSPGDEVYYLGVIDCLTHYGMIKKIEHFWKGLSHDRTQISALPPAQYGDRFYNFIEGVTMSPEVAAQETREKEEAAAAAAAAQVRSSGERATHRVSRWKGSHHHHIPPMPDHQPPAPPPGGRRSPEGRETIDRAYEQVQKLGVHGVAADGLVHDRVLRTATPSEQGVEATVQDAILPVVREHGEHGELRPRTPAKDKDKVKARLPPPPPTPPKDTMYLSAPESCDSGYAGNGNVGRDNCPRVRAKPSRESLEKSLPPLPKREEVEDGGGVQAGA